MTNSEAIKLSGAVVTTGTALVVSRIDAMEQFLRMGASAVAILSGCTVIVLGVLTYLRNKPKKKHKHEKR
jgi:hypothetical protein